MGTQTMGSQGNGNTSSLPKSYSSSLSTQSSLYNLTLDEVETQLGRNLGKPLTSMNLDELLRTVWIAESSSPTPTAVGAIDDHSSSGGLNHGHGKVVPTTTTLCNQSSFSLSRDLSSKTVDEVWREIQQGKKSTCISSGDEERRSCNEDERHHNCLGEMTLENFLVHAGVVIEPSSTNDNVGPNLGSGGGGEQIGGQVSNVNVGVPQGSWMQYQQHFLSQQMSNNCTMFMAAGRGAEAGAGAGQQQNHVASGCGELVQDSGYSEVPQMVLTSSPLMGTLSDTQAPGRKRTGDVVEKTVERRQKRMIKNRESAARSRARKQAYTNELENKVSRLEEENRRLKSMKEVEKALPPPPQPKFQLRRARSAPL